ncbi:MAG: acetyl/propionyl/methylcrotonyl-CoA carboxylase subunit alpha [Holophagaceae bacterium]
MPIKKILVANRGEIACRIMRTCSMLGIKTVAVYSEIDRMSQHVRLADEAYCIGPAPSSESYLQVSKIIEVAKTSGADAIHPGYGFLSENADAVAKIRSAGITFIGPSEESIRLMGSKTSARKVAIASGCPVVPGIQETLSDEDLLAESEKIGYPIMLKAAMGGGGKGMRLVSSQSQFLTSLQRARSEALNAFGDDSVYIEKAIVCPRHIEIQIFGDTKGNLVYLWERECTIQRRHQKVIEECPSPFISSATRKAMGEAALKVAKSVEYVGAGTVEFLVDKDQKFYFLEMNTRLQVEHPVTEWVTGQDLVSWQIMVAEGMSLPLTQDQIPLQGWSIECRIYAEDPERKFIPSPGKITYMNTPSGPYVRNDSGVYQGSEVSSFYDPMISKLSVWGPDRISAIGRMKSALCEYQIGGIRTNLQFHRTLMNNEDFIKGIFDTSFLDKPFWISTVFPDELIPYGIAVALIDEIKSKQLPINMESQISQWSTPRATSIFNRLGIQ